MTRVSWLRLAVCSTALISAIGCEGKTHVVGGVADGGARGDAGGGTGIPAECNVPPCLARLLDACRPSGTCVRQNEDLNADACISWENGFKIVSGFPAGLVMTTASKNGSTCWVLRTYNADARPQLVQVVEDGSGIQVATMSENAEHGIVITCAEDGSSAVFNPACEMSDVMHGDTSSCVPGPCAP